MKKILMFLLLFVLLLTSLPACTENQREDEDIVKMDCVYIMFRIHGQEWPEYKIDLVNGKLWIYIVQSFSDYEPRDSSGKNEGFYFVKNLEEGKINDFLLECKEYGIIENWDESYPSPNAPPEYGWRVTTLYSDGTEKTSRGNSSSPNNWGNFDTALENLTGLTLLSGTPPQPTFWFFGRPVYWW